MKFYECRIALDMEHDNISDFDNVPDDIIQCLSAAGGSIFDDSVEGVNHFATPTTEHAKVYVKRQMEYYAFTEWDDMPDGSYQLTLNGVVLTMTEHVLEQLIPISIYEEYQHHLKAHTPKPNDQPITPHTVTESIVRLPATYNNNMRGDDNGNL